MQGKYNFASDSERNIARIVWNRTCMDRYPDHLKNARKTALRQVNSANLADTKGNGPKGLKPEVWNGLVDIWLKPEWTKKSDANRCNRAAKPDSALHTGGSISFREHKKRMVNNKYIQYFHIQLYLYALYFGLFPYRNVLYYNFNKC